MNKLEPLAEALERAERIAVLTGAGMSTDSGIPDFRSRGGLYDNGLNLEAVLSESYYRTNPESFWGIFKQVFQLESIHRYEPNPGHHFLKELEALGKRVTVITQNVDGLHEKAGSSRVLHLHGSLYKAFCPICGEEYGLDHVREADIPRCAVHGCPLKPDVVLFGGRVRFMEEAYAAVGEADVFLALGTSLQVSPANDLPRSIRNAAHIAKAVVNKEPTGLDYLFSYVFHDSLSNVFQAVRERWKS